MLNHIKWQNMKKKVKIIKYSLIKNLIQISLIKTITKDLIKILMIIEINREVIHRDIILNQVHMGDEYEIYINNTINYKFHNLI